MSAAALIAASGIVGCSTEEKPSEPAKESSVAADKPSKPAEEPSSAPPAPVLSVGQSGTYTAVDSADETLTTKMQVTVKGVKYVDPAGVGTSTKAKGQYAVLTLTVKNVGSKEGSFSSYGIMKWQDASTAAQNASTLETTGEGQELDTTYAPGQSATGDIVLDVARKGGSVNYGFADPLFTVTMPK
ncbi:DUF4352 domain-containing protein [Streptomyces sp. CAU 1734]|uniref:DUF4352 domain-containing protein n=1 Tax=Streptomyces sp. CAU 1734 TaxID=3140360 RepID=UPI003261AE9A